MAKCAVKRGFLILHECKQETSKLCLSCGRPACEEHLVQSDDGKSWICVDCHGKTMKDEDVTQDEAGRSRAWRYGYRDRYYRSTGYGPYFAGTYYDSYYDDYDARAFDQELADAGDLPEDDGGADFMDS